MTRARDCLVLAFPAKKGTCEWLGSLNAPWLAPDVPSELICLPDGSKIACNFQSFEAPAAIPAPAEPDLSLRWFPVPDSRSDRLPATLVASASTAQSCKVTGTASIGERIALKSGTDMAALGNAIHACIATAFTDPGVPLDDARVARILAAFELEGAIEPSRLVGQISALDRWISSRWPDCRRLAEIPIESVLPNGQVMHGRIDLLLDTRINGHYVIDPSPIPRYDVPQLHQSKALVLLGAGREKKIYAVPPYCNAEPLVFDDVPFRTEDFTDAQGQRRACHRCGANNSFLDEIIGDDVSKASGKTWQCSDADFCREQRESARVKEAQQA